MVGGESALLEMKKDISLAVDSARIFAAASAAGLGGADFSAAAQFLAEMAEVRPLTHD